MPNCAGPGTKRYRVLYASFVDKANRFSEFIEEIGWSVRANNGLLAQNSRQHNGYFRESRLRTNCIAGAMTIEPLVVSHGAPSFFGNILNAVAAQYGGMSTSRDVRYLVYMDASADGGLCGEGQILLDNAVGPGNANNVWGGQVAVVYRTPIDGTNTCWVTDTPLHEILHTMGAVQPGAPTGTAGFHCRDGNDVMCYNDGTPGSVPQTFGCGWNAVDCGRDTYLSTFWPTGGSWLNTHWNVADTTMNGWIAVHDS